MRTTCTALVCSLVLTACATGPQLGVRNVIRQPQAEHSPTEVFGHQVRVRSGELTIYGELIACDDRGVYLELNAARDRYHFVPWPEIARVTESGVNAESPFLAWTLLGSVITIGHGVYIVYTLPTWSGLAIPVSVSGAEPAPDLSRQCETLRAFARFPQGMPTEFGQRYRVSDSPSDAPANAPVIAP